MLERMELTAGLKYYSEYLQHIHYDNAFSFLQRFVGVNPLMI